LLEGARPVHWVKNLLLYAGFLFTAGQVPVWPAFLRATAAFILFSLLASAAYLLNDVRDADSDRLHPVKKARPVASGRLSERAATAWAIGLIVAALAASSALGLWFAALAAAFVAVTLAYSYALKHVALLDVMALAIGYVLRAVAGAAAIAVPASFWLATCTFLLALFLGLCKRRAELTGLDDAVAHRASLEEYSEPLLDQLISVVTASSLVAYALYTYFTPTSHTAAEGWHFRLHLLTLTIPFVVYGIFRYLYLVYQRNGGGAPETVFLRDRALQWNTALWALSCAAALLVGRNL
jgi:4-hydroxybenzoate polyprenyltransferase